MHSCTTPLLVAPSPSIATPIALRCCLDSANAIPVARATDEPTTADAPKSRVDTSLMCIEPPMPMHRPWREPYSSANIAVRELPLATLKP